MSMTMVGTRTNRTSGGQMSFKSIARPVDVRYAYLSAKQARDEARKRYQFVKDKYDKFEATGSTLEMAWRAYSKCVDRYLHA